MGVQPAKASIHFVRLQGRRRAAAHRGCNTAVAGGLAQSAAQHTRASACASVPTSTRGAPAGVARPAASSAPSARSRSRAARSASAGGASSHRSPSAGSPQPRSSQQPRSSPAVVGWLGSPRAGSVRPSDAWPSTCPGGAAPGARSASASARGARSASRTSGRGAAGSAARSAHSRRHRPGPSRPAALRRQRPAAGRPAVPVHLFTLYAFTQQGAAGDGEADTTKLHALTQQGAAGCGEADTTIHSRAVFLVCPAARPAPARPRRWSAAAAETRTVRSRLRPAPASCCGRRASPASTTARTPATVSDASAMGVASTMRRAPARPARAASPCAVSGWRLQQQQICSARSASLTCMHVQLQTQLVSARLPPARHWPLHTDVLGACTRDKAATYSHAPCGECAARERKRPPPQVAAAAPCAATARPRPPGRRTVGLREHGGVLRRRREVAVEWADARVGRHAPRQQPRHPAHLPPAGAARASHARMYTHAAGSLWAAAERTVAKHTALLDSASVVLLEQQAEPAA